jgi:dienelactone hydrolase
MKNLKFLFWNSVLNGSSAQLKAVAYKDGSQVLNGFKIAPTKKKSTKPGILILPAWHGIDKASKDIAGDLAALGYYSFIADIYRGNYPKDNAEAGQNLVTIKRTTRNIKTH